MIMRLVGFFIFSLLLHTAALVYPVTFSGERQTEIIQLNILPIEPEGGGADDQGGSGIPARRGVSTSHRSSPAASEPSVKPESLASPAPQGLAVDAMTTVSDNRLSLVSPIANSVEPSGAANSRVAGSDANGSGTDHGAIGNGDGSRSSGIGSGRGSGSGNGSGSAGAGLPLTQARYRDTPKPDYPESARREGREGRVLLRVLVDDQGRSKEVEINSSSGNDALDRAAAEAMRRWRFHPARYGDKPVESWLRVPIEFRLADAKPW